MKYKHTKMKVQGGDWLDIFMRLKIRYTIKIGWKYILAKVCISKWFIFGPNPSSTHPPLGTLSDLPINNITICGTGSLSIMSMFWVRMVQYQGFYLLSPSFIIRDGWVSVVWWKEWIHELENKHNFDDQKLMLNYYV